MKEKPAAEMTEKLLVEPIGKLLAELTEKSLVAVTEKLLADPTEKSLVEATEKLPVEATEKSRVEVIEISDETMVLSTVIEMKEAMIAEIVQNVENVAIVITMAGETNRK